MVNVQILAMNVVMHCFRFQTSALLAGLHLGISIQVAAYLVLYINKILIITLTEQYFWCRLVQVAKLNQLDQLMHIPC